MRRLMARVSTRFLRFVVVGGIGFLTDAAVLSLLTSWAGWHPLRARLLSFLCAVTATWWLNRHYTFNEPRVAQHKSREYSRYLIVQGFGAALNYAVFAVAIVSLPVLKRYPVLPLALGSVVAMFFNYFGMRWWVFPSAAPTTAQHNESI